MSTYPTALLNAASAGDAGAIAELLAAAQPNIRRYRPSRLQDDE